MSKSKCFVCAGTASNSDNIVHKFKNLFLNKLLPFYHEGHEGHEEEGVIWWFNDRDAGFFVKDFLYGFAVNPPVFGPASRSIGPFIISLSIVYTTQMAQIKDGLLWSAPAQFLTRSLSIPRSMLNLKPCDKCSAWGYVHNCRLYANPMRCLLFHIFNRHKVHGMQRIPIRRTIDING